MMKGRFITLEGVEGCGKTTQVGLLRETLEKDGHLVMTTREPGGTPIAESIRDVLLDASHGNMSPATELLLYEAARAQHVHERILPALKSGTVVVCDRFADSTAAYQGAGRGLPPEQLNQLHDWAAGGLWPDLTLVLDIPAKEGLERARCRGRHDRMEQEALDFHERVRQAFLELARREPERIKVIDARQSVDAVATEVQRHARALLA